MSVFGIICEVNPLHTGHRRLLTYARQSGAEQIVCVMSGNTVQRGEFAVADCYARAEALVRCGADLVLELPFPWCSGSAESFARGGIAVLRHFCDTVLFGSECGEIDILKKGSAVAASQSFRQAYRRALATGEEAAAVYHRMLCAEGVPPLSANDRLGMEYMRAARDLGASLSFQTLARTGASYGQSDLCGETYPSALAIRKAWQAGRWQETEVYLPSEAAAVYRRVLAEGRMPDPVRLDAMWLSFFRLHEGRDFEGIVGTEGGLANRLCAEAGKACHAEAWRQSVRTKRYTDAHIRRVMLYCLLGVQKTDLAGLPLYTTLLAANARGRDLLSARRKNGGFPVFAKAADAPKQTRQYRLGQKVASVYTAVWKDPAVASELLTQKPYLASSEANPDD